MQSKEEIWKDAVGYEGYYQISNFGRLKSLPRAVDHRVSGKCTISERILKFHLNSSGYPAYGLSRHGITKTITSHRLVAIAFIPNTHNLPQVNHIDCNKLNNHVSNLEWCDSAYNNAHARTHGLVKYPQGEDAFQSKLTEVEIIEIRKSPLSHAKLGKIYGVDQSNIGLIKQRKSWKHVP